MTIDASTTAVELAALVSRTLEAAGIKATLSGGGAVSMYSDNEYESKDLDFVTSERRARLSAVLAPLGFSVASDRRRFAHPETFSWSFPLLPFNSVAEWCSTRTFPGWTRHGVRCASLRRPYA